MPKLLKSDERDHISNLMVENQFLIKMFKSLILSRDTLGDDFACLILSPKRILWVNDVSEKVAASVGRPLKAPMPP